MSDARGLRHENYRNLGYKNGDFPESQKAADETIALPVFPELTEEQLNYVVEMIVKFIKK